MEPSQPNPEPRCEWPRWLIETSPAISAILNRIDAGEAGVAARLPPSYTFKHVYNQWVHGERETALRTKKASAALLYAQLWENSESVRLLDQAVYSRSLGVSRNSRAARAFLAGDDLVGAFVMYRGIFELTANLASSLREVGKIAPTASFEDQLQQHGSLMESLKRQTLGSRVAWQELFQMDLAEIFDTKGSDAVKYKAREDRMDLTSKSVMADIDKLDRKLPGTRATYEILCEFLHPNIGVSLGIHTAAGLAPVTPDIGTPFIEKTLGSGPPVGFVWQGRDFITRLFEQFAKTLELFVNLTEEARDARVAIMTMTQDINRQLLAANPAFKHPYLECPCGSGKKLRFCCSSTTDPAQN